MLAHNSAWMEVVAGLKNPPRSLAGRIFGKLAKKSVLGDAPIRRNMPTEKSMKVQDERDFALEQQRLLPSFPLAPRRPSVFLRAHVHPPLSPPPSGKLINSISYVPHSALFYLSCPVPRTVARSLSSPLQSPSMSTHSSIPFIHTHVPCPCPPSVCFLVPVSFVRPSDSSWSWSKEGLYSNIFTLARQHRPSPHAHSHSRLDPVQSKPLASMLCLYRVSISVSFPLRFFFSCVYVLHIHICLCIRPRPAPARLPVCLLYHTVTASVVVLSVHVRTESVPITNRRSSHRLQALVPCISTDDVCTYCLTPLCTVVVRLLQCILRRRHRGKAVWLRCVKFLCGHVRRQASLAIHT